MAKATRTLRRAVSPEEKEQRRDEILAAAKRVFAGKGFAATTIADVAREADLSYGSIYWYFDSKDALFHALMESQEQALRSHIQQAMASFNERDTEAGFRAAVRATLEFFEGDRELVRLLFRDSMAMGDRFERHLHGIYERFIDDLEAAIRVGQDQGLIVGAPPRMIAFSVAALIGQIAYRRLATDDGASAGVVADFIVSMVLDGLRAKGAAT